jgi:putative transposase
MNDKEKEAMPRDYRCLNVVIRPKDELFSWCQIVSLESNNLYNASLFRCRQLLTSAKKAPEELTDNEKEVLAEVETARQAIEKKNKEAIKYNEKHRNDKDFKEQKLLKVKMEIPKSGSITYEKLTALMRFNNNPDFFAKELPAHASENTIKTACRDIKSFFESIKEYNANPSKFLGRPNLPDYKHKQGYSTFIVSNQEATISRTKKGRYLLKLPKTKIKLRIGWKVPEGNLKQVIVAPEFGNFKVTLIFDNEELPTVSEKTERMIGIDFGVNNLMAVVNNIGEPSLLFNGRPVKAINQFFNKNRAKMVSEITEGGKKYEPTPELLKLSEKRHYQINDYFFKTSKALIAWCVENRIDTIVIGHSNFWKQESNIGKQSNQNFCTVPFNDLIAMIQWRAAREGIKTVVNEESYTSRASFLDGDFIPVYKNGSSEEYHFSGKRPHRGIYKAKDGTKINADLNGAANILRKAFPNAFKDTMPSFNNVVVIKHIEYWTSRAKRGKNAWRYAQSKVIPMG